MFRRKVPQEKLFCEIEGFPKQIMTFVSISKAGKTPFFAEPNTKENAKVNDSWNGLVKYNEFLLMKDRARAHTKCW